SKAFHSAFDILHSAFVLVCEPLNGKLPAVPSAAVTQSGRDCLMSRTPQDDSMMTNPTLLLRIQHAEPRPRELAWTEFRARYGPIIAGFARKLGAKPQDLDDVIQDV